MLLTLSFLTYFLITTSAFPTTQLSAQPQYPVQQEANKNSQISAHHGFMYAPNQQVAQLSQYPTTASPTFDPVPKTSLNVQNSAQVLVDDPDFQMLARSLQTGTGSVGFGSQMAPREMLPCSSDGRSVTIDHLRISPESLVQIARLAQAFGSNPDWKKLRLADMKSALDTQMHPTHQYSARSIGL